MLCYRLASYQKRLLKPGTSIFGKIEKVSRTECNEDIFNRLLLTSDTYFSSIRPKNTRRRLTVSKETLHYLKPDTISIEEDSDEWKYNKFVCESTLFFLICFYFFCIFLPLHFCLFCMNASKTFRKLSRHVIRCKQLYNP